MTTAKQHYADMLAEFYSWLYGGHATAIRNNAEFFNRHNITRAGSGTAIDLGAGSGFQSIPLAAIGFTVTAIDFNEHLLGELRINDPARSIRIIQDDLLNFDRHSEGPVELIVCMTDTLLHLETQEQVRNLFGKIGTALEHDGKFILTCRDLTRELTGLDRFLPVRSDDNIVFTCFLEYAPETVTVHDIVYFRKVGSWQMYSSCYPKLRLSQSWLEDHLTAVGLHIIESENINGLITIIAGRDSAAA